MGMIDRATVINTLENGLEKFEAIDMETMVSALAWLKASDSKWISVADRLPPDNRMVIGFTPVDGYMFIGFYSTSFYAIDDGGHWYIITSMRSTKHMKKRVSHWMPLPEPPKEVKQG